ncbi:MAG: hypothetical protein H6847_13990 [Hyphomonas sp.]|nr:hypothetical protein [Hyphomonas sp.]MCB9972616.1 hypothetical protein [Hyphomonas sp.]
MPDIEPSRKLSADQEEYRICSKPYVFFRLIFDKHGARLMTATASENCGGYRAFEDQKTLTAATARVLEDAGLHPTLKEDHAQRSYIETPIPLDRVDREELVHLASTVLLTLGITDVQVLALAEMLALYDEFSVSENDEAVYLSDGMWITADGNIVEK